MMRLMLFSLLLTLAACALRPVTGVFRDTQTPIWSAAAINPGHLAAEWFQVADFADPGTSACTAGGVAITRSGDALKIDGTLCLGGVRHPVSGGMTQIGPGRFSVARLPDPWWILWLDTDARTMVVGTPSGSFGMILNRTTSLPADRLRAAQEILAWNGYDQTRFHLISR